MYGIILTFEIVVLAEFEHFIIYLIFINNHLIAYGTNKQFQENFFSKFQYDLL